MLDLDKKPSKLLDDFLGEYTKDNDIDINHAKDLIELGLKQYDSAPYQKFLENQWYESLKTSRANFDLYNHNYYFTDLWVCWVMYSRGYIRSILKHNSLNENNSIFSMLKNINTVADLGCGLGLTTASLKNLFPNANVIGTNLHGTKQYFFCEKIADDFGFIVKDNYRDLPEIDLLFASEYFEHIHDCLDEILDLIENQQPKYLYLANSFNTTSYGHFQYYKGCRDGSSIHEKDISRKFNKLLRDNDYSKIKTKLWNNKPMLWKKNNLI